MKTEMNTLYRERAGKVGITELKKVELDRLNNEVLDAQNTVTQLQAVVDSLTLKSTVYSGYLADATAAKEKALANKNLAKQMVNDALNLLNNSEIAFNEMVLADAKTKELSKVIKNLMDKLIYSVEIVNKMANVVIRKKTQNPLISDDLISMINQAGTEGNNAIALTLVALQSTFAAQASNIESEADATLQLTQAMSLYETMTGTHETLTKSVDAMYGIPVVFDENAEHQKDCLWMLFVRAYKKAEKNYKEAKDANDDASKELAAASANLSSAVVNLKSLQLSLAAGNAAAMAS